MDAAHRAGLGVILDWAPGHFPRDSTALGFFDGTPLYEHDDPARKVHPDWKTYVFDYRRPEVVSFLLSSAAYWIEEFHLDGLRVDAVASMLWLDFSRGEQDTRPGDATERQDPAAVAFLQKLNDVLHAEHPDVLTIAEESSTWPGG